MTGDIQIFKLVLVGDRGTGKTTFVKRHLTGKFQEHQTATQGAEVHLLTFYTNRGQICFNVWDTNGEKNFDYGPAYYTQATCAIIMYDVTASSSLKTVESWYNDLTRACNDIPIVLVGNKIEEAQKGNCNICTELDNRENLEHCMISVKMGFGGIHTPFIYLARKLLRDPNLKLVAPPSARALENQLFIKENRSFVDPALEAPRRDFEVREQNLMTLESRRRLKVQRVLRQKVVDYFLLMVFFMVTTGFGILRGIKQQKLSTFYLYVLSVFMIVGNIISVHIFVHTVMKWRKSKSFR